MNNPEQMSDDQLISLVICGDIKGIKLFYVKYRELLLRFFRSHYPSSNDDFDSLCDEFIFDISKKLRSFDKRKSKLSSWIVMIASRRYIDILRTKKQSVDDVTMAEDFWESTKAVGDSLFDPGSGDSNNEKTREIKKALAALTERERNILKWRAQKYENEEIAKWLGMEKGAVATAYSRAKTRFSEFFRNDTELQNGYESGDSHGTK